MLALAPNGSMPRQMIVIIMVYLYIFLGAIFIDVLHVYYLKFVHASRVMLSMLISSTITFFSLFALNEILGNADGLGILGILAYTCGSAVGTCVGMAFKKNMLKTDTN